MSIDDDRKKVLDELVQYVSNQDQPKLNFICTHNSRRSHLSQVWAQVMAHHHGVPVETFSGGTEATAFNPNAVAALQRAGFAIKDDGGTTPNYEVSFDEAMEPMICFSKEYDHDTNPKQSFAAVMTCSEADSGCPVVFGAGTRIKLFYQDPKVSDGTPHEAKTYDERCAQIATEMKYVFSSIKA